MSKRKKNNIIIGSLLAVVLLMAVGYAAFSSVLNISGTGSITSSWNIKITNVEVSNIVGDASDGEGTTFENLTATINSNLVSPGDSITYDVTVRNDGSLDAILTDINLTESTNPAISFSTSNLEEGTALGSGEEAILKVTVTYNNSVTSQPDDTSADLSVTLTYEQKGSGTIIPGGDTVNMGGQEVELVSSGDGLYEDEYETGKYTYKGANPNNYITFNNEKWRIVCIEADGSIKIIRNESIGQKAFDIDNSNKWDQSDIKEYLNDTYLLTLTQKDKVVNYSWSVGYSYVYDDELTVQIERENANTWLGEIGIIRYSEYVRADSNNLCVTGTSQEECGETNWMFDIFTPCESLWTISPSAISSEMVLALHFEEHFYRSYHDAYNVVSIFPMLYLTSKITLSGTGTQSDPYIITN